MPKEQRHKLVELNASMENYFTRLASEATSRADLVECMELSKDAKERKDHLQKHLDDQIETINVTLFENKDVHMRHEHSECSLGNLLKYLFSVFFCLFPLLFCVLDYLNCSEMDYIYVSIY